MRGVYEFVNEQPPAGCPAGIPQNAVAEGQSDRIVGDQAQLANQHTQHGVRGHRHRRHNAEAHPVGRLHSGRGRVGSLLALERATIQEDRALLRGNPVAGTGEQVVDRGLRERQW